MLSSEVFPAPFGPMIEAISPRRTENDISSTARTPPNRFDTAVAASSSSSAGFTNPRSSHDRHMRRGYGWHDADAITRMQQVTSPMRASPWAGISPCRQWPRRGTITSKQAHEGRVASTAAFDTLPVTLLTGFLGSGKTTLLRRALAAPSFSDTAVIVNEIGAIPIDHFLVDFVEGSVLELPGGCLCCMVREDLAQSLRSLIERRDAGEIRAFRRIAIETSGLADPAPILFTLGADPMLDQRLRLGRVVTLVDAVEGASTLDRFAEAARQVAVADALVVSKTDLAPFGPALAERLDALNPAAERILGGKLED